MSRTLDSLDFRILRWQSPTGTAEYWGGRRLIDPRMTCRRIAERVGVSETAVRARLRAMREAGYIGAVEVCPNPSLFGASILGTELPIHERAGVDAIFARLGDIEGVLFARYMLDDDGRKVRVYFVADEPERTERRVEALRRLAPLGRITPPTSHYLPACDATLSSGDWEFLGVMADHPEMGISELAEVVGTSQKTAGRRYHHLLDTHACWYTFGPEMERGPWALLVITCQEPSLVASVEERAAEMLPDWVPLGDCYRHYRTLGTFGGVVMVDGIAPVERVVRELEVTRGVRQVRRLFPFEARAYSRWCTERLGALPAPRRRPPLVAAL